MEMDGAEYLVESGQQKKLIAEETWKLCGGKNSGTGLPGSQEEGVPPNCRIMGQVEKS